MEDSERYRENFHELENGEETNTNGEEDEIYIAEDPYEYSDALCLITERIKNWAEKCCLPMCEYLDYTHIENIL